jgi:predicted nuclease of predicted toxin-antitoxin system
MKLLLDENLSPRLPALLADIYPGSSQLELVGLRGATDAAVWDYAKAAGFVLVSKDNDFRQMSFHYGAPPKVVWLRVGNAGTHVILRFARPRRRSGASWQILRPPCS